MIGMTALGAVYGSGGQIQNPGLAPGIPEDALQYNRTDTTPDGQMEQVRAMETHVFNYRNLTLALNCTQNCELKITSDPNLTPKTLSLTVEPIQNMSLTMNMTREAPRAEMTQNRTLNFYLDLEPNANSELTAQIRLHINQTELDQELNREVNASRLTWQYYDDIEQRWINVPSWIDQNNYLVCNTTHFSTWTVAEISDQTTPEPEPSTTITPTLAPTETPAISPSNSINPTDAPTQTNQPSESQSPSPSASISTPDVTEQKGLPTEYLYLGIGVAVAIIAVISLLILRKRTK